MAKVHLCLCCHVRNIWIGPVDLSCETIDTADASQEMICVAIHVRFKLKSGGHSCQLLFARTKTVPKDMTQPRAELLAASLNASTGHVIKTALGDRHANCIKLTDSQVALFWINCGGTVIFTLTDLRQENFDGV